MGRSAHSGGARSGSCPRRAARVAPRAKLEPVRRLPIPEPPLTDGVVALRPVDEADVDAIVTACQDPEIQRFIPVPRPYRREHAEAYVARAHRQWASGDKAAFAIVDPEDPAVLLGVISCNVDGPSGNCGYWVAPGARGWGIAGRALALVTRWAFDDLGLAVLLLEIHPDNAPSLALAHAAGYHEAGRLGLDQEPAHAGHLVYARLVTDLAT